MAQFQIDFLSNTLSKHTMVQVLIPNDAFEQEENEHYKRPTKTLYLLHGYTGNCNDWLMGSRARFYSEKYNLAIVMPSGENSFYLNNPGGHKYETFTGVELPQYIQKTFNLSSKPEDNFIAGLSMGGFGAVHTGMKFPETFSKIAAFSSAFIIHKIKNVLEGEVYEIGDYDYYTATFGDLKKIEESENNPEVLIKKLKAENRLPDLYVACGTEDFLLEQNREFEKFLNDNEIKHIYKESAGAHDWDFWNEYLEPSILWALG